MSVAGFINGIPVAASEEHHDYVEVVATEGQTEFTIDYDITAAHKIEVDLDGRDQPIEGVHWTRDIVNNKIILSEGVHVGSVFKAKVHIL